MPFIGMFYHRDNYLHHELYRSFRRQNKWHMAREQSRGFRWSGVDYYRGKVVFSKYKGKRMSQEEGIVKSKALTLLCCLSNRTYIIFKRKSFKQ